MVIKTPQTNGYSPIEIKRPPEQTSGDVDWSLLSAQGKVLFYIALCPKCSVQEISVALGLTERAVWGLIRELRRNEMLRLHRDKRRHRYTLNLDAPMLHPTIKHLTLRPILGAIAEAGLKGDNEACVHIDGNGEDQHCEGEHVEDAAAS